MIVKSIVVAIAAVLLALGMIRQREFHVNRLWIEPVAVTIILVFGLYGSSVSPSFLTAIALGVCVGAGLGIVRAKLSLDHVDVSKRCIMTKPNIWMAVIFAAAFALKFLVGHGPASSSLRELTDFLMCVTATSICAQRWQPYRIFRENRYRLSTETALLRSS